MPALGKDSLGVPISVIQTGPQTGLATVACSLSSHKVESWGPRIRALRRCTFGTKQLNRHTEAAVAGAARGR